VLVLVLVLVLPVGVPTPVLGLLSRFAQVALGAGCGVW
jgi:hypothetical protein